MEYRVKRMETKVVAWSRTVEAASEEEAIEKFEEWFSTFGDSEPDEEHDIDADTLVEAIG